MANLKRFLCASLAVTSSTAAATPLVHPRSNSDNLTCPGYKASNVQTSATGMTADLTLAGPACSVYGEDLKDLTLTVEYQTRECLKIILEQP